MASTTQTSTQEVKFSLIASDFIAILLMLEFAYFSFLGSFGKALSLPSFLYLIFALLTLHVLDLYSTNSRRSRLGMIARVILGSLILGVGFIGKSHLIQIWYMIPLSWQGLLLPFLAGFCIWIFTSRAVIKHIINLNIHRDYYLVLGDQQKHPHIEEELSKLNVRVQLVNPSNPVNSVTLSPNRYKSDVSLATTKPIPDLSSIPKGVTGVIVSPDLPLSQEFSSQLMQLRLNGYPVYDLKNFYQHFCGKFPPSLLKDCWFTFSEGFILLSNPSSQRLKRLLDLVLSSIILLILLPFLAIVALFIKLDSSGPIFYTQWRTGLKGKAFRIYKFRSMTQDAEKYGCQWAQVKDPRITRVGMFLRLTRIDELPQLLNVLRGEMSLIGPRPERPEFDSDLEKQIPYYGLRYLVKPGITGWAQVMYPYGASIEDAYEKLSYDFFYIKNYSIWLDVKILLKTIQIVLLGKGR